MSASFFLSTRGFAFGLLVLLICGGNAFASETRNLALGARYAFEPAANYALTRDAGDSTQLTDGRYAGKGFWMSRDAVGWKEAGPIRIEIDLGATRSINGVCINSARGNHAGVSYPEQVDILVSSDRKLYNPLGDLYQGRPHTDGTYLKQKFCASNLLAAGRYVLLVMQPRGSFTFLDEIEVLGGSEVAAKTNERQITASVQRQEISDFLKPNNKLRHQREALYRLAAKMMSSPDSAGPALQSQIKSFMSRLQRESAIESSAQDNFQAELLALHRMALAGNFSETLIVWRKNPWAAFSQIDSPTPDRVIKDGLNFDLMRHGSTSNAFVLTNNSDKQQNLRISAVSEGRAGAVPQFEVREVVPVIAANLETIGDALKPLENGEIAIKPGESKQIWLTALAGMAASGEYTGKVSVVSLQDNPLPDIVLRVKVWPAAFSERQNVFVNAWAYLNWNPIKKVPGLAMNDLFVHHVNVAVLHQSQIPWPNSEGVIDYAKSDEILRYQKGARKRLFFLAFNDKKLRSLNGKYEFMSPAWKLIFKKWIKDWVAHLKAQGLSYQDFAFYPVDEPKGEEVDYLLETAKLIKEIDPRLEVYTTMGNLSSLDLIKARNVVDIFQVITSDLQSVRLLALKGMGKEVWAYTVDGGKTASPLKTYRLEAWKGFKGGASGIGFWAYADAGRSGTSWNDFDGKRPDFSVVYEGEGGKAPVSSKRWEAWREGVEDYELLELARLKLKSGKESAEFDAKIESVINKAGDYGQFELVRRYLLSVASR